MSTPAIPDHKVALRDYLRTRQAITNAIASHRIVMDIHDVNDVGNWIVLSRAGGTVETDIPLRRPRVDVSCYGANRWEAVRLAETVAGELGVYNPRAVPRIVGTGVIITDIQAEGDINEGTDERVPGLNARVPFAMQALRLVVHRQ